MNTNMLYVKLDDIKAEIQRRIRRNIDEADFSKVDYEYGYHRGISYELMDIMDWLNSMEESKESKVTDELREEVSAYLEGLYPDDIKAEDGFFLFFKRCKDAKIDHGDADAYAWLNTLFGYDIGLENAKAIDCHMFNEYDMAISEVTHKDIQFVKSVCYDLKLELDFSKWAEEEPKCYVFFEEV